MQWLLLFDEPLDDQLRLAWDCTTLVVRRSLYITRYNTRRRRLITQTPRECEIGCLEEKSIRGRRKHVHEERELRASVAFCAADFYRGDTEVNMRVCPNTRCVAFGRIVFSVATRCPLCRWDLKSTVPASETAAQPKPDQQVPAAR
jgi:hypothetical protein